MRGDGLTKLGNQFLEFWVVTETLKIVVDHQAVGIFVAAIDGFAQMAERVVGMLHSGCHARK